MQQATGRTATGAMTVTLTLIGWSSVPLFLRYFADSIDAWTSNGWRYGVSALLWAPVTGTSPSSTAPTVPTSTAAIPARYIGDRITGRSTANIRYAPTAAKIMWLRKPNDSSPGSIL